MKENYDDDGKGNPLLLVAYVRVWCVATACRVLGRAGRELLYNNYVGLSTVIAFGFPRHPIALVLAFGSRVYALVASFPYVHDSQNWCLHSDIAMLLMILIVMKRKWIRSKQFMEVMFGKFSEDDAKEIISSASIIIRVQFILFYIAAALYKANEGFMTPKFSCAPVYLMQILERNVPATLLEKHGDLLQLQTAVAPALILFVEALIPFLLWFEERSGIVFAALFHWMIAITPPPNDIASFGTQTLTRLILFVPDGTKAAEAVTSVAGTGWRSIGIVSFAALTTALQPGTWSTNFDFAVPLCGGIAGILCVASFSSASAAKVAKSKSVGNSPQFLRIILWFLAACYALVVIPLGLQDMGTANMFSSLRMHGGSNHYFLPTGILQHIFANMTKYPPDRSMFGEIYGGGVMRIEHTNSSHLVGPTGIQYPGEIFGHTPNTRKLLRKTGHSGRQWSPMSFACNIGNHPPSHESNRGLNDHGFSNYTWNDNWVASSTVPTEYFTQYTLTAAETRRQIREAQYRHPHEAFDITGALLPGTVGDELWRSNAVASRWIIRRRFDSKGDSVITCEDPNSNGPCGKSLNTVLLMAPSDSLLSRLLRKALLSQPYPIVSEDIGNHKAVHCFGP